MGDVTAVMMDVITEKSGHTMTPCAVSVCLTPAAPSPLPIPYPVIGSTSDGVTNPTLRTKVDGAKLMVVGSDFTACHGNEAGTLKEVVSLNTGGPCFLIMGAPTVLCELGMIGITGSPGFMNKQKGMDAGGSASDAGGAGGGGGGGGGAGGPGGSPTGPQGPQGGGGSGGGGSASGADVTSKSPQELAAEDGNTQAHRDAREQVARDFYGANCPGMSQADIDSHVRCIDTSQPVRIVTIPPDGGGPNGDQLHQHTFPGRTGQYFASDSTTTADQLGTNPRVLVPADGNTPPRITPRQPESYTCDSNNPAVGLQSTAAPAHDTWSHSGEPYDAPGGGTQIMVPRGNQGGVSQN